MARTPKTSFGDQAERRMRDLKLDRRDLESARWGSVTEVPAPEFLRVYGELPDGRKIVMDCWHHRPEHIQKFRIIDERT